VYFSDGEYLGTIIIGLYAVLQEKLAHHDLHLALRIVLFCFVDMNCLYAMQFSKNAYECQGK